ncbi:MAG: L-2-amino-thiazoline-4-carboxylic acid hydrolase [Lachnospiraceae bacterium]|nr:L-2-amino-thiazoline-4-carboxylic acid hydrolase [Lachnospiraceae bacterium]
MKNDDKKMQNPVSMFVLFARFFAIIARRLEERLGEEGLQIMKEAVNEWGFERGKDIARRARANGRENDLMSYLENYDMERSDDFGYENKYTETQVCQEFQGCVFAETWMAEGQEKYGRIYCENIDPAIAKGYNEDLVCEHDKIMYDDQKCTFCFYMREKEEK